MSVHSCKSRLRLCEISDQPSRVRSGSVCQFVDDQTQFVPRKAIEKKMGNQEIVRFLRRPFQNVLTKKVDMRKRFRTCSANAHPGQLEHRVTRIYAIDVNARMGSQEFAKETAVAFAENQCALRSGNSVDPVCPGVLQRMPENNYLHPVIMRRNKIEIHSQLRTTNNRSGVNRTRSANAVR